MSINKNPEKQTYQDRLKIVRTDYDVNAFRAVAIKFPFEALSAKFIEADDDKLIQSLLNVNVLLLFTRHASSTLLCYKLFNKENKQAAQPGNDLE